MLHATTSMRLKRIGDWIHYVTNAGPTVYYNEKNGDFQWTEPTAIATESPLKHIGPNVATEDHVDGLVQSSPAAANAPAAHEPEQEQEREPPCSDWKPYKDPQSGCIFWYNIVTKVSQWECPVESIPAALLKKYNATTSDSLSRDLDKEFSDEAFAVDDEDDLGI